MSTPLPLDVRRQADGTLLVETVYVLVDGTRRPATLSLQAANAGWLAGEIERYLHGPAFDEHEQTLGPDTLTLAPGGTDWEPQLGILNRTAAGDPRGALWLDNERAARLAAALRAA